MAIICNLIQVPPATAASLAAGSGEVAAAVAAAKVYSGVYRYWDGIEFLLAQHSPGSRAARWRELGAAVSADAGGVPGARVVDAAETAALDAELEAIPPDDLAPHYDAAALDTAGISPRTWAEWEETFDPLGQLLEHYSYLQYFVKGCAKAGEALLLVYEDNGDDD
jgi:Domain of unknown function (DUF1877)